MTLSFLLVDFYLLYYNFRMNNKLKTFTILPLLTLTALCSSLVACKSAPLNINDEEKIYNKPVHPREYYFDLYQESDSFRLKKNKETDLFELKIDFTDYVKDDMPQAGDKLIFQYHFYPTRDLTGNIIASIDIPFATSPQRIIASNLKKYEETEGKVSFILQSNLEEVIFNLKLDQFNKYVFLSFDVIEVGNTTDIKKELKEEKRAIRKKYEIINKTTEITSDYDDEEVFIPTTVAPTEVTSHKVTDDNKELDISDVPALENNSPSPSLSENTTETSSSKPGLIPPSSIIITPEQAMINKEAELKKLAEEEKKRQEALLLEEQKKKEAEEKARLEREAKEAEEKRIREEKEKQEEELRRQQKLLEETIKTVANSNVPRYEKEYLDDYAVDNYTFDMDLNAKRNPSVFPNPNEADEFNRTLLMKAAKTGNDWQIKALVNANADVNLKDNDGWTALMYAVRYQGNMDCVQLLLNAGADVKAVNNFGMSSLVIAANYNNNPEIIKELLSYYSPTDKDVLQSFVLVLTENTAEDIMQLFKVNLFLDKSVPLNSFYKGKTPLMYAAESGSSTKVIKLLLDNNSIVSLRSSEGKTAFDYAKENPKLKHDDIYWSLNNK